MDPVFRQIELGEARPLVSIITEIELLGFPRLTRQNEARINSLLSEFTVVAVDERITGQAVALKRRHGLKTPDAISRQQLWSRKQPSSRATRFCWIGCRKSSRSTPSFASRSSAAGLNPEP